MLNLTVGAGRGSQSEVWRVAAVSEAGETQSFALKVFSSDFAHNSLSAARREFDALVAYHRQLEKVQGVRCPTPVAFDDDGNAYLMSWETGLPLDEWIDDNKPNSTAMRGLADYLLKALQSFYEATDMQPYADFQPQNVLVVVDGVVLLDPTIGDPFFDAFSPSCRFLPASADIGYWLHSIASQAVRRLITQPVRTFRRLRFGRTLTYTWATRPGTMANPAEFVAEAKLNAGRHLRRMEGGKGLLIRSVGRIILYGITTALPRT